MDAANGDLAVAKLDAATVAEPPPTAATGEKRTAAAAAIEDAGGESDIEKNWNKRTRNGGLSCAEEKELRSVAEIVLVLSALGTMRAARDPTAAEKSMMAKARAKVVQLCQELAPRDIIPREAFGGIIEDLGLTRLKEQKLGFRAPKLSIAEKMEITKKKMAESKQMIAQVASHPAQRPQAGMGVSAGTPTTTRPISSEKPSHLPASAPVSHLPSTGPVNLSFQPSAHQVRPSLMSTGLPSNNLGNASTSAAIKFERPQQRSDGRLSGPSSATHTPVKTANTSLQAQSAALGNVGTRNKAPDQSVVRPQVSTSMHFPAMNPHMTHIQTMKPVMAQGVPGTIPAMHRTVQGVHYVQTSQLLNHHLEVSKMVQTFLHPKPLEHPSWDLPSREYMNKVATCQICKSDTTEVESVLICDACEKGFHLKCLQTVTVNQKVLPRGEWYCPRCLTISNGKPFPPKYGRVTRNVTSTKIISNASGVQTRKKSENQDQAALNLQKSMASVNSSVRNSSHSALAATKSGMIEKSNNDTHKTEASQGIKKEEPSSSKNVLNDKAGIRGTVSVEDSCKPSVQHNLKSEQSCPMENLEDNSKSYAPANSSGICTVDQPLSPNITDQTPSSSAPDDPPGSNRSPSQPEDPRGADIRSQHNANEDEAPNGVDGSLQPSSSSEPVRHLDSNTSIGQNVGLSRAEFHNEDEAPTTSDVLLQPPSSTAHDHPSGSHKNCDQTVDPSRTEAPSQNNDNGALSGAEVPLEQHDEKNGLIKHTNKSDESEVMNHHLTHEDGKHTVQDDKHTVQDDAQDNQSGMKAVGADTQVQARDSEDDLHKVDWVGDASRVLDTKKFYQSCCINGADYTVYDYVLVRSGHDKLVPWKLQAMWEDPQTSAKWVMANQCYFPGDLPAEVGHPSAPEDNEVYESNDESNILAGLIQGPCAVLPVKKFGEENVDRVAQESEDRPVYFCRWFYDKTKGVFLPLPRS